ncbi:hypothetical protein K474DRAFT_1665365 [Panus rudis PR-1116 ss-1]|nr:hypothetical protein K474DRAFT_1665365 [Panus rudis PR-1116 ss-1]
MIIGTGIVAAGLLGFFYVQRWLHTSPNPNQTPTWQNRMGEQPMKPMGPAISNSSSNVEPRSNPAQLPLPDNNDNSGSNTYRSTFLSVMAGKGFNPDTKVPEKGQDAPHGPQRQTERGATYTKAGNYKDGYSHPAENYEKTPHNIDGKSTTGTHDK